MSLKREFLILALSLGLALGVVAAWLLWAAASASHAQDKLVQAHLVHSTVLVLEAATGEVSQKPQHLEKLSQALTRAEEEPEQDTLAELGRLTSDLAAGFDDEAAALWSPEQVKAQVTALRRAADDMHDAAVLAAEVAASRLTSLVWTVAALMIAGPALVLVYWRARVLAPIERLTKGVSASGPNHPLSLASWQPDSEVGALAHEFAAMQLRLAVAVAEANAYALRLSRSNTSLNEFATVASHDLKEPLRAIQNQAAMLEEDGVDRFNSEDHRRISRISQLAVRAQELVANLLDLSRVDVEDGVEEQTDPADVINEIGITLGELITENNGRIEISTALPPVPMNRSETIAVFSNLVVNGLKYNDKPDKRIEIGAEAGADDHSVFFVRDNGIGIKPQHRDKVFKMFRRLTPELDASGSGAGLAMVRGMIQRHGGEIWFESEPGNGSTFYFGFPEVAK